MHAQVAGSCPKSELTWERCRTRGAWKGARGVVGLRPGGEQMSLLWPPRPFLQNWPLLPLEDHTQITTEKLSGAYIVSKITLLMKLIIQTTNTKAMNHLRKILASNISIYLI